VLIVVDGGASRCRAAAFDRHGARCAEVAIEAHASLSLGVEAAAATVLQAVHAIAVRLGGADGRTDGWAPTGMVLGLAGSLGTARRTDFIDRLRAGWRTDDVIEESVSARTGGCTGRIDVITDGQAQLLGATGGRAGVCVAVGTGSVVHWQDGHGVFGMGGGWGFPVGDEGSAAWLGVQALNAWTAARDRRTGQRSALFDALQARIGDDIGDLQRWTTCTVSGELGRLAPLVSTAAEADDAVAMRIRARGAEACAALFALAPPGLPHWLAGGLAEVYRPVLEAAGHRLQPLAGDALDGLHRYASMPRYRTATDPPNP